MIDWEFAQAVVLAGVIWYVFFVFPLVLTSRGGGCRRARPKHTSPPPPTPEAKRRPFKPDRSTQSAVTEEFKKEV